MAIDITRIDEQIRRLEELKRIASDPEMMRLLEDLVLQGRRRKPGRTTSAQHVLQTTEASPAPRKGDLIRAVRRMVETFEKRFTVADVLNAMNGRGFNFAAKNPSIALNGVLRKLARKGELRIAKAGSGRRGNQYERVFRLPDAGG